MRDLELRRVQRRGRATAVVSAVLVLVAAAAIVSFGRSTAGVVPSPTPTASTSAGGGFDVEAGGWGWWRVGEPAPGLAAIVAHGFLGECVDGGKPASCTSGDGARWQVPGDQALFRVADASTFGGWSVASAAGIWVAVGTIDTGVWRSTDGTTWTAVTLGAPRPHRGHVQASGSGFAILSEGVLFTSGDGLTWTQRQPPAANTTLTLAGAIGVTAAARGYDGAVAGQAWSSPDGVRWTAISLPPDVSVLSSTVRMPSGRFLGLGARDAYSLAFGRLLESTDGVRWKDAAEPSPTVRALAVAAGRALLIGSVPGSDIPALFESADGMAWRRVALLDREPLAGDGLLSLGDRVALLDGSHIVMVGLPVTGAPAPASTPTPAPSPRASLPPVVVRGGWRWHALTIVPDRDSVVRLAKGYLARCGESMCTSADGWTWLAPPDPAVFSTDGLARFTPITAARRPDGVWALAAGEGMWHSADGVHWEPSTLPPGTFPIALIAGHDGFALYVGENMAMELLVSDDGATWSATPTGRGYFVEGRGDTSGGLIGGVGGKTEYAYSADGRTWVPASLPPGTGAHTNPRRLPDGRLVAGGTSLLLGSQDGRSWKKAPGEFEALSYAVVGDRILVKRDDAAGASVWESSDGGRTFHQLFQGITSVGQFGDLAVVETASGETLVGAPLSAQEAPATTPTPTRSPSATPTAGQWTPEPTPPGGISEDVAMHIAKAALGGEFGTDRPPSAFAHLDLRLGRWIWEVSFTDYYGGPLNAQGESVTIDFFTGEVLAVGRWIS